MKIISKFRDYYDHEVGYFGYDPTRVYDRRNKKGQFSSDYLAWNNTFVFAICGQLYPVVKVNNRFFFKYDKGMRDIFFTGIFFANRGVSTKLNIEYRQPVLLKTPYRNDCIIPKLADYGFAAEIPSREMYAKIYEFLGFLKDNPVIPDKRTDKEKVVSHGFDSKTSFRPKIK